MSVNYKIATFIKSNSKKLGISVRLTNRVYRYKGIITIKSTRFSDIYIDFPRFSALMMPDMFKVSVFDPSDSEEMQRYKINFVVEHDDLLKLLALARVSIENSTESTRVIRYIKRWGERYGADTDML